jgi:hypothetical protein
MARSLSTIIASGVAFIAITSSTASAQSHQRPAARCVAAAGGYPAVFKHTDWICCQSQDGLHWEFLYRPIPKCQEDFTPREREQVRQLNSSTLDGKC